MPQNIIQVSDDYKNDSKSLDNIFKHNITITNLTTAQDITQHVDIQSFKIEGKKTALIGLISSDTISFDVETDIDTEISTIISKGDKIEFKDTYTPDDTSTHEEIAFVRYAQSIPTQMENLEHRYRITLYDRIKDGLEAKFDDHVVKIGWYMCNNNVPEQSLAHYCAHKMGFTDDDLLFEDIRTRYSSTLSRPADDIIGQDTTVVGDEAESASVLLNLLFDADPGYLIIPYAHFKKGNKVMEELRGMVESVLGNVFMRNDDKLMLLSPFNEEDYDDISYTFDDNIQGNIQKSTNYAKYDKVTVNYAKFLVAERQECWRFYNKNSYDVSKDHANMMLPADTTSAWYKVEWVTPIAINLESDTPEILVEDTDGNDMSAYFNYEIDVDQTGGKIRFHNLSPDTDIVIQRFKIYGQPLEKYSGNETSYTETSKPTKPLEIENKWIQTEEHANMIAKYAHHLNCKDRDMYQFQCYYVPFLAINNLVTVNKRQIANKQAIVTEFVHGPEENIPYTAVTLEEFLPYEGFLGTLDTVEATQNIASDKLEFEQERLEENGVYSEGLPVPQPEGLMATGSFKRIWVEWDEVVRSDLQGYNVYVADITDSSNPIVKKYFADTNGYSFEAPNGHEFEIEVSTKCIAGESEKAGIVTASTQLLETADYEDLSIVNAKIADLVVDKLKAGELKVAVDITTGKISIGGGRVIADENGIYGYAADGTKRAGFNTDGKLIAGGGRIEVDEKGLRANNDSDVNTMNVDSETGNAYFRGQVIGAVYNE